MGGEWFFFNLLFLISTNFTFGDVIFDLGTQVRPVDGLSGSVKMTFNSRVCSMSTFANLWSEAGWSQASQTFKDKTILSCQFIPNIKVGEDHLCFYGQPFTMA